MEMRGTAKENGTLRPAQCTGAADHARKLLDVTCSFGDEYEFAMRALGNAVYMRNRDESEPDAKWQKLPADDEHPLDELSPDRLLALLRGASVASEYGGEETVRGVSATRYRLTVDCEEAELAECGSGKTPVDVWIAADDTVRRIALENDGQSITIEFFDFGAPVEVEPPPAQEVEALDDLLQPCPDDAGAPIRTSRAVAALRRAGFSVRAKRNGCFTGLAGVIDNNDAPRALEREGIVMCHLYETSSKSAARTVVRRGVDGGDAELVLANLECLLFTDRPDPEPGIERLEQAFRELER